MEPCLMYQIIWKLVGKCCTTVSTGEMTGGKHTGKGGSGDVYASWMFLSLTAQQCLFILSPFLLCPTGCWSVLWWWA